MNSTKNTTKPVNEPSKKNRRDKAAAAAAAAGIAGAGAAYAAWPGSEDDAQAPELYRIEAMPAEGVAGVIEAEPVAEQSDNPGQVRQFGDGVSVNNDNRDRIVVETDGEIVGRSEGIGVSAAPAEDVIPIAEKQADFDDIDAEASVSFGNDDTSVYRINGERETAAEYHDVYGNELTVVDIDNDALFDGYVDADVAEVYADFEPSVSAVALDDAEMSAYESEEYMESGDNTHAEEYSSDTIEDDIIGDEDTFGDDPLA